MILKYPTIYKDSRGIETSAFISDGESLKITLRGITFEGHFWELTVTGDPGNNAADLFDLREVTYANGEKVYELNGILDNSIGESSVGFSVSVQIPIRIIASDNTEKDAIIDFGTNEYSKFDFILDGERFESERYSFEYGLIPENTKNLHFKSVKCCINCRFGDYSPYGNQEYGDMMCFKNCKEDWLETGYVGLKDPADMEKIKTRFITTQEAWWCEAFKLKE